MITMLSTFEVYGKCDKDIYCETDAGVIDLIYLDPVIQKVSALLKSYLVVMLTNIR